MLSLRRMLFSVMFAVALGCTSGGERRAPHDAGGDATTSTDARTDGTKEAGPQDGRPTDTGSEGSRPRDTGSGDAGRMDASATDARSADTDVHEGGLHDVRVADALTSDADAHADAHSETTLSISPLTLTPPFSTTTSDYYLRCAAGTNTLTVSMTAAPGSTIALQQPIQTTPSTAWSGTVAVAENEAIVVDVTTSGTTDAYWVRCLPHDFPKFAMTLHPEAGTPVPGYYLVGNVIMAAGQRGYAVVLDGKGVPVWYHSTRDGLPAVDVNNVISGTISYMDYVGPSFTSDAGALELHDLADGNTTFVQPAAMPLSPHELQQLPNGDYVMIAIPIITGVDLTGLGNYGINENMLGCNIQEIDAKGALVWQWAATDHFDPVKDCVWPQSIAVSGRLVVDAFHCNSIDVDPDGNLLVSARQMDSIFLISRDTGAILWKMGGATYTVEGAPYISVVNDPLTSFHGQHDARLLPDNLVSLYDNQTEKSHAARAIIYEYDVDAGTATPVWVYKGLVSSLAMGSLRFQENGASVIGWGIGAPDLVFTEIDGKGNDLLDFSFTDGDVSYRAIKIPTSAFDIGLLRTTAGAN